MHKIYAENILKLKFVEEEIIKHSIQPQNGVSVTAFNNSPVYLKFQQCRIRRPSNSAG
jgi:hypothetical protein